LFPQNTLKDDGVVYEKVHTGTEVCRVFHIVLGVALGQTSF